MKQSLITAQVTGDTFAAYLVIFILGLAISIGIFLVLRVLFLWYWKVPVILSKQQEQILEQKRTNELLEVQNQLLVKLLNEK